MKLRNTPSSLSLDTFVDLLKEKDFFDYDWNKKGHGFDNSFELQDMKGEEIVVDKTAGLIWQKAGSTEKVNFDKARNWVEKLNQNNFASLNKWRLPTVEEALSLLKPKKAKMDLFIDPIFDDSQWSIWTADQVEGRSMSAWAVSFSLGGCQSYIVNNHTYVRAVHSIE